MEPLAFLFSLERLGMKFGLDNMAALCASLGHPERSFASVLIAGTNGKGSVTALTAAALDAAGYHVGRYTSPHLERLEERFVVAGREVEAAELSAVAAVIQAAAERLVKEGVLATLPTFFECATAIAFELFRKNRVEIAVLEVGLGGRLDATNVVSPIVTAITSIDLDHQAQLGDDLASIAREKAGIIKPGVPVVCGPLAPPADAVVADVCATCDAPMIRALDHLVVRSHVEQGGTIASLRSPAYDLASVRLALRGQHQVANAAVAVCVIEALAPRDFVVPEPALRTALSSVRWPARLELISWLGAEVLFDAAHNPAGAAALAAYLGEIGWNGVTLVFGAMRDKDAAGMLAPLLPSSVRVILTTPATPRALPASDLLTVLQQMIGFAGRADTIDDPETALRAACVPHARVVVAGSIFLVGPLRGILR